jgi:hypothetical protein
MTAIKIYYNNIPGLNLVSRNEGALVWSRITRDLNNNYKNSLFPLLNLLGIDYTFSKDADSIPFIDVGSLHPSSTEFFSICEKASNTYKKAVIFSTQEPWQWPLVEKILNQFTNLFLFDTGTPLPNNGIYHERYGNFPTFLIRHFAPHLHITILNSDDAIYRKDYKKMYSCLLARWRPEKHLLFSMLSFNGLIDKGYVTYNPLLTPHEAEFALDSTSQQQRIDSFVNNIDILMPNISAKFKKHICNGLTSFQPRKLNYDVSIDQAEFEDTANPRPSVRWFDPTLRAQPKFIYEHSCFSLVCESFSGIALGQGADGLFEPVITRPLITEKSITPMLNGHPCLVFGEAGFYSTLEDYGFVAHDELFDLSFDRCLTHSKRIEAIKDNMCNQDFDKVKQSLWYQMSETNKKIRHNKHNLYHTNSKMWQMVKKDITTILDRIQDLNV